VGDSGNCTTSLHALLWDGDVPIDLGNLGGSFNNMAFAINDQRQVVGQSDLPGDATSHAFLWQNGTMMDLGVLPGDVASFATGINNKGQVVGTSVDASGNIRGFLWENGVMTDLNTLFPADSNLYATMANKINSHGQISGMATVLGGPHAGDIHAFLATPVEASAASSTDATPAIAGRGRQAPKVTLPENVRKLLLQQFRHWRIPVR
jgi:probable HAF family extracellular repeat protein